MQLTKYKTEIQKTQEQTSLPKGLEKSLQPEEARILAVKYQSKQFGVMEAEEVDLWADALLLKIFTITGWVIPEGVILTITTDQFRKKLLESYARCNADEIEYAFRNYGTVVKDWGKNMNLSLIDEVMLPYLDRRVELGKIEQQARAKEEMEERLKELPPSKMTDQEIIDFDWAAWKETGIHYISESTYEVLVRHEILSDQIYTSFMSAANSYLKELEDKDPTFFNNIGRKETQERYAKKLAVAKYFREHKIKVDQK